MAQHNVSTVSTLADADTVRSISQAEVSPLNPAPVTTTEAEAAAIPSRTATTEERGETAPDYSPLSAEEQADLEAAVNLSDFVSIQAGKAMHSTDTMRRASTVALALAMVIRNGNRTLKGYAAAPDLDDMVRDQAFADAATRGVMIFRNSETEVAAIRAEPDMAKRNRMAVQYIRDFGKGKKLAGGPETLSRDANRLAAFFRDNTALHGCIAAALDHKDSPKMAYPAFRSAVQFATATVGADALSDRLAAIYGRSDAGTKKGGKAKGGKAAPAATAPDATVTAPAATTEAAPAAPDTIVLPAPEPVVKTVTRIVEPNPEEMTAESRMARVFALTEAMGDDEFESLFQRMGAERDRRADDRKAAALEEMRIAAEKAAQDAADKAAQVLAVEVAMAPAAPAKAKRRTITAKAA